MLQTYNTQPIEEQKYKEYNNNSYEIGAIFNVSQPQFDEHGAYESSGINQQTTSYMDLNTRYEIHSQVNEIDNQEYIWLETNNGNNNIDEFSYAKYYVKSRGINNNVNVKLNLPIESDITMKQNYNITRYDIQVVIYENNNLTLTNSLNQYFNDPLQADAHSYYYTKNTQILYYETTDLLTFTLYKTLNIELNVQKDKETEMLIYVYPIIKDRYTPTINYIYGKNNNSIYQTIIDVNEATITGIQQIYTTIEVLDMPNLMWTILTMPFTFISMAFNLTLWPGTPYAVDIGSLFLALLGVLIFIFIMKLIIKAAASGGS